MVVERVSTHIVECINSDEFPARAALSGTINLWQLVDSHNSDECMGKLRLVGDT